jgi:hypothetical protein
MEVENFETHLSCENESDELKAFSICKVTNSMFTWAWLARNQKNWHMMWSRLIVDANVKQSNKNMKTFALHIKVDCITHLKQNKNFKYSHASKCEGTNNKDDPKS